MKSPFTSLLQVITLVAFSFLAHAQTPMQQLAYTPAPADNPLKGFVPYAGQGRDFPHSLEFNYLPLRSLMTGPTNFDWTALERLLNDVSARGCQTIVRVWLEYPGKPTGIPQFLLDGGLKTYTYTNTNTQPFPPKRITTPDYEDLALRKSLRTFIHALGERYDGDPRLGYITAGLLGTWGEWHTYPRNELWASKAVQAEVIDAYESAFHRTPVLLRYPAGPQDARYALNANRRLGYHDDSFGWATLDTDRTIDDWYFVPRLHAAGPAAEAKWRTQPIGGEIRPELWPCLWTEQGCEKGQDFAQCVRETHVSWLMDSSTSRPLTKQERERAIQAARLLGYEFHVSHVQVASDSDSDQLNVAVQIENRGVAPFYADWPAELGIVNKAGDLLMTTTPDWALQSLSPGTGPIRFTHSLEISRSGLPPGAIVFRLRNPLPNGKALRFANHTQDQHRAGWLTLTELP